MEKYRILRGLIRNPEPGLHDLGNEKWYGSGCCGVCGSKTVVPQPCRWWDPDDGWRVGVLCEQCRDDKAVRGPRPGDLAYEYYCSNVDEVRMAEELLGDDYDGQALA